MTAPNYGAALPVRAQAKRRRSSQAKHRDAKRSARLGATETRQVIPRKGIVKSRYAKVIGRLDQKKERLTINDLEL